MIQKNIDVVCTFFAGEPPVPHRFRVKDKNEELHVYRISQVLDTVREKVLGDDIWTYKCQGVIGNQERLFVIQYNLHHARWQLVKIYPSHHSKIRINTVRIFIFCMIELLWLC